MAEALPEGLLPSRLLQAWHRLCPGRLKSMSMPVKLEGNRLVIGLTSAPARQEMRLLAPRILEGLRKAGWSLEELRIVSLPTPPPPPPPPPPRRIPSPQELERARTLSKKIGDPKLARRLYEAITAQLSRG